MRYIAFGIVAVFLLSSISLTAAFAQSANTCGINFVSGNSVTYGNLQSGATSSEQTITLSNPGTMAATLSANGTNWTDGAQTNIMNVGNTKFSNSSGTYSAKNPLTLTLQNIGTLQPSVNTNTYWQLQANLLSSSFTGNLTQAMNFRVSCDGSSGGGPTPTISYPDGLGSAADGTATGVTTGSVGKINNAWGFNGGYTTFSKSNFDFMHKANTKWTLSYWAKLNSQATSTRAVFDNHAWNNGLNGVSFGFISGDRLHTVISSNNNHATLLYSYSFDETQWHHYTFTFNDSLSSNNHCMYVDGNLIQCVTKTGSLAASGASSYSPMMGVNSEAGNLPMNGNIDEFSVWSRVLTSNEISQLYNSGNGIMTSSLADMTGLKAYYDFEQTGTVLTNQAISANPPQPSIDTSGLVSYYTFEENPTSPLTNHCSETSSTQCTSATGTPNGFTSADKVTGKVGTYSWNFDNVDNFVDLGNAIDDIFVSSGEVTFSMWYKPTDLSSNDWLFSQYADGGNRWDIVLTGTTSACGTSGKQLYVNVQGSPDPNSCSSDISTWLTTNTWHHITITHKDTENTLRFYVDGQLRSSVTNNNWFTAKTNPIYLCTLIGGTTYLCNGQVDDLSIWSKKLSDDEIQQVYNNGAGVSLIPSGGGSTPTYPDGLGSTSDGTAFGGVTTTQTGKIGNAWGFDGVDDYVNMGTAVNTELNGATKATYSFWFNSDQFSTASGQGWDILGSYAGASASYSAPTVVYWQDGSFNTYPYNYGGIESYGKATLGLSPNTWYHMVVVFDGSGATNADRWKLYLNGAQQTYSSFFGTIPTSLNLTPISDMKLGKSNYGSTWQHNYDGKLDELSVWSRSLSSSEISSLYNNGVGNAANSLSNLSGLLTYYNFDETSGSLVNHAIPP